MKFNSLKTLSIILFIIIFTSCKKSNNDKPINFINFEESQIIQHENDDEIRIYVQLNTPINSTISIGVDVSGFQSGIFSGRNDDLSISQTVGDDLVLLYIFEGGTSTYFTINPFTDQEIEEDVVITFQISSIGNDEVTIGDRNILTYTLKDSN